MAHELHFRLLSAPVLVSVSPDVASCRSPHARLVQPPPGYGLPDANSVSGEFTPLESVLWRCAAARGRRVIRLDYRTSDFIPGGRYVPARKRDARPTLLTSRPTLLTSSSAYPTMYAY